MKVALYYLSGNYGTIDTTIQTLQDGVLLDDGYLDASDLDGTGIVLTRAAYNDSAEGRQIVSNGSIAIVKPEELGNIGYVTVDGQPFLKRVEGGFERCIVTALGEILGAEEGEDEPDGGAD